MLRDFLNLALSIGYSSAEPSFSSFLYGRQLEGFDSRTGKRAGLNSRLVGRIDSSVFDGVLDVMSQAYAHNYQCRYDVLQTCHVKLASTAK
jgi:hypothetical protein